MLEWVIIEIDPDNERETDKNNAERHATVRNSSPNPTRHTRKIFVTADIGDSLTKPQSAMTTTYWKSKASLNAPMINSRVSQRRDYRLALQRLILFAFVFLRRNDAIFDGIGVHGNADPIEDCEPESEPRACDRSEGRESEHNQGAERKKKSDAAVTFVNMAEPGNDAEQRGHCVAGRALRCLGGAFPFPIATIAGLRVFRQTLAAIRTKHRIRGLSGRSVCVFHQIK